MSRAGLLEQAAAHLELRRRRDEERLRYYRPTPKQQEIHQSHKRFRAVLGANRAGKSWLGAVETVLNALGPSAEPYIQSWPEEQQAWWYARFAHRLERRSQVWAATENWDVHRDVLQPLVLHWLPAPEIEDIAWRKKEVMDFVALKTGVRIVFKSYETGAEGFQGASLPFVWLDEEPPYDIWNECEKRVMDTLGAILLTFTPLSGIGTWSYDRLYLNTANDPETVHWHMTWEDNPYLDADERRRLLQTMPPDEVEARAFGRYLLPGGSVFRFPALQALRPSLTPGKPTPLVRSDRVPGPFTFRDARVEVWEPPAKQVRYVIGIDTAEGLQSGDNSAACVVRAATGEQVAEIATRDFEPKDWALLCAHLGYWYNTAYLVPERNNDGKVVVATLRDIGYPNLYRDRLAKHENPDWGFQTTGSTRPMLIALGQEIASHTPQLIRSPALVDEMLTFVRTPTGRPEAAGKGQRGGKRDDRVFAFVLAQWGRQFFGDVLVPVSTAAPSTPGADIEGWLKGHYDKDEDRDEREGYARWDPSSFARWRGRP